MIGRFNDRFRKWIDGYENWRTEGYYFHTVQGRLPIGRVIRIYHLAIVQSEKACVRRQRVR